MKVQRTRKASVFSLQPSLPHFLPCPIICDDRAFNFLVVQVGLAWVVLLRFPKSGPCQPLRTIHFKQPGHSSTALWELLLETEISMFTGPYLTSVKCYKLQNTRCSEKGSHKTINSCNLFFTLSANIANGNPSWNNASVEELFKSMRASQSPMQDGALGHGRAI